MPAYSISGSYFRSSINTDSRWAVSLALAGALLLLVSAQNVNRATSYLCAFIGVAALLGMAILAFSREVFEVDTRLKQYRLTYTLFGAAYGDWESLPPIKAVVVKYFSHFEKTKRTRLRKVRPTEQYIVLLSVENRATGITVHKFALHRQDDAEQLAAQLAAHFQVPHLMFDKP
jgi:hypothetical protein